MERVSAAAMAGGMIFFGMGSQSRTIDSSKENVLVSGPPGGGGPPANPPCVAGAHTNCVEAQCGGDETCNHQESARVGQGGNRLGRGQICFPSVVGPALQTRPQRGLTWPGPHKAMDSATGARYQPPGDLDLLWGWWG